MELADLGGLHLRVATTAPSRQKSTVPEAIGRTPVTSCPSSGFLTGREPLEKLHCRSFRGDHRCTNTSPTLCIEPKEWLQAVGVLWDFPGTSGRINGPDRETAERIFAQFRGSDQPSTAGHGWSLPEHLICTIRRPRIERHQPSASHRHAQL